MTNEPMCFFPSPEPTIESYPDLLSTFTYLSLSAIYPMNVFYLRILKDKTVYSDFQSFKRNYPRHRVRDLFYSFSFLTLDKCHQSSYFDPDKPYAIFRTRPSFDAERSFVWELIETNWESMATNLGCFSSFSLKVTL